MTEGRKIEDGPMSFDEWLRLNHSETDGAGLECLRAEPVEKQILMACDCLKGAHFLLGEITVLELRVYHEDSRAAIVKALSEIKNITKKLDKLQKIEAEESGDV